LFNRTYAGLAAMPGMARLAGRSRDGTVRGILSTSDFWCACREDVARVDISNADIQSAALLAAAGQGLVTVIVGAPSHQTGAFGSPGRRCAGPAQARSAGGCRAWLDSDDPIARETVLAVHLSGSALARGQRLVPGCCGGAANGCALRRVSPATRGFWTPTDLCCGLPGRSAMLGSHARCGRGVRQG
jgi:hypothetical protein